MDIKDALEDMVTQFAYQSSDGNRRWYHTGGLSALEGAFAVLGWDDPHYVTTGGCEIVGCEEWATCVAAYPRRHGKPSETPHLIGFGFLCSKHYRQWNGKDAEPADDLGRQP